ncbi:MAG: TerC family protein [Burkholderiales bacterium]|nr:TerC family protein [Burkholderiales bacterium]
MNEPAFWISLLQIVSIDILLGGDNAVVIALACRGLPEQERKKAMVWGVAGAVGIRVALIFFALMLLEIPYLRIAASLMLFWIGVNLIGGQEESHGKGIDAQTGLFAAVRTIIIADAVMSLDNIIGVAGAAKDSMLLIVLGISVSVPVILWGSSLVLKVLDRFPVMILLGGALIGWIAGGMLVEDVSISSRVKEEASWLEWASPAVFAILSVVVGKWRARKQPRALVDLVGGEER